MPVPNNKAIFRKGVLTLELTIIQEGDKPQLVDTHIIKITVSSCVILMLILVKDAYVLDIFKTFKGFFHSAWK